nr:reverse transcriptase domain-containing protein [Tanacetum cinerariifolium]
MITYGLCQRTTRYDKIQKNDLWLLNMFDAKHQNGYANVAWVIAKWMKKKGAGTQKESQIYCGQFILKLARKCRVLTEDVVRSLSAAIYCRDLDTITLKDLIDSDGNLIPKDPQLGVPRPSRAFMQDLYDRMGRMIKEEKAQHELAQRKNRKDSEYQSRLKVSNRGLKRILERTIGENRASWSDKLDDALWAFRTAYKTPIGCTPYKLVYEKACHLSIKLEHKAYWALKQVNVDLAVAGDHRKVQLNELNELRDHAYENSLIYKEKAKRIHDSKIKNRVFNIGDQVILFNSRLKIFSGKLKTHWSRPFTIAKVFPYGTVELSQANGPNFKVNGHRVKHYFGGDVPQLDCPDCEVFHALSFSVTRASHPQLHFGNPVYKSYRLTFFFWYT